MCLVSVSLIIACIHSQRNPLNDSLTRQATVSECQFARLAGLMLLFISLISFVISTRTLLTPNRHRRLSHRDTPLVLGMFVSSFLVILISTPSVVLQCLYCRRLCVSSICHIEGFNSFFNGCVTMYMLVALSIIRFATTASSSLSIQVQRKLEHHNIVPVIICFLLSGVWAIPPIFGRMSAYVPEGLGFHCGLDWFDRSLAGRIYFLLLFIGVFLFPIIIVIYINIYIQRTVHRLTHLKPSVILELYPIRHEECMRRHVSRNLFEKEMRRLNRLQEDRRFVFATGISVVIYLIAWTPYSVIALTQLFGHEYSIYHPWLMTTCAVLAKLSMITNPVIYIVVLEGRQSPVKV